MGTNYYVERDACPSCGRGGENLHVGKSSAGWKFLFQRHDDLGLDSKAAWECFLRKEDGRIYDEYGSSITAEALLTFIEEKQACKLTGANCYQICGCCAQCKIWNEKPSEALDAEGYRISDGHEFS